MAEKSVSTRQEDALVLFLFMLIFLPSCRSSDYELLLSLKSSIKDPQNSLHNWNQSLPICQWNGVVCHNSSQVAKIELQGKNLSGRIPDSVFQFPYIETIDLSNNQFFGDIPGIMSSSSSTLRYLNLSNNNLTGSLPGGSSTLLLETMDLSNNMISGEIPENIGLFSGLKYLDFGGNVLTGTIPKSIKNMTSLQFLTLASNHLTGEIPKELGFVKSLRWVYLGYNNFSGEIPKEIGELTSLYHLDLVYNNLTGEIPSSLGNLTNLQYLFLYFNKLTGPVPLSIFNLRRLISLDLSENFLSGEIPELVSQLQNLEILHLFSNNFTGRIPKALSSLSHLRVLQLWSNKFSGEIPQNLGKYNNLTVLDLSTNNLTGRIPGTLCGSGNLMKLILFSNFLEGELPKTLSGCKSLQRVRLQSNRLSGKLSSEFTTLPFVYFLDLSNNDLFGEIDDRTWEMPQLQMLNLGTNRFHGALPASFGSNKIENLVLSGNEFSGQIPTSFGNFSELMVLNLRENMLTGTIPDELSSCKKLVNLDLSHNQLNGQIPESLSRLPVLGQLDLSVNQLSGEIPPNLGKVESLVQVNISHNHFHGSLPYTGAFLAINSSAVAGNDLCGGDTKTSELPPCKGVKNHILWFFLSCLFVISVILVLATSLVIVFQRRKELKMKRVDQCEDGTWELQFFNSNISKSISVKDILSSTRDENLITRGLNGVLYKGNASKNGMQFLIEEMNLNDTKSSSANCINQLGKLQHPNIVKLIATCKSEKRGFLVYEYVEGKDLNQSLQCLSWCRRKNIAIGISRALRYLHYYCSPSIIVGDLSLPNITLDSKDEARLRLRLPELFCSDKKFFMSSAFIAPETRESKAITEKSDVYGFGLVLIELLTARSPCDAEFGVHDSIVEWARYCYSDCHLEMWVDPIIRAEALDDHNTVVEMMNLALQCTAGDPAARPCATSIAKTLESIACRPSSCVLGFNVFSSNNNK